MTNNICILGHIGEKNLGDELMLKGLMKGLDNNFRRNTITIISHNVDFTKQDVKSKNNYLHIKHLSIRNVAKGLLNCELLIILGGTHFHDYEMKGKRFYYQVIKLLRWLILFAIAKLNGSEVVLIGHGIGPLNHFVYRTLVFHIFKFVDQITVRDEMSLKLLKELQIGDKCILAADLAYLNANMFKRSKEESNLILGISLLPFSKTYKYESSEDFIIAGKIASSINMATNYQHIYEVRLFPFFEGIDDSLIRYLTGKLNDNINYKVVPYNNTDGIIKELNACTHFVGFRLHSCILATLLNLKLFMVAYHPKCYSFAEEIKLDGKWVLSLSDIKENRFQDAFMSFIKSKYVGYQASKVQTLQSRALRNLQVL